MELSLLIPAFNEAKRLPKFLESVRAYFSVVGRDYEVIVIDDGSTDGMDEILKTWKDGWPQLVVARHEVNQGRGQAIRTGCGLARGAVVLYADADGATPIAEEYKLYSAIRAGADIAIGSRLVSNNGVAHSRAFYRGLMGGVFSRLVRKIVGVPVQDTQCGFKMWRREVGEQVLASCAEKHWLLDVEFLAVATILGHTIAEIPVNWSEIPGSKVHVLRDSWRMFLGLWSIRTSLERIKKAQSQQRASLMRAQRKNPILPVPLTLDKETLATESTLLPEFDAFASSYGAGMENPLKCLVGRSADDFILPKVRWLLRDLNNRPLATNSVHAPNLLDLGCGTGRFLWHLKMKGFRGNLFGSDLSPGMLSELRRTWGETDLPALKVCASEVEIPYEDRHFDIVVASAIIHHVDRSLRRALFPEILRVLKPGGRLYVFEHNPFHPITKWVVANTAIDKNAQLVSASQIRSYLRNASFTSFFARYLLFFPPRWQWSSVAEKWLDWLPAGGQYVVSGCRAT